MMFLPCFVWFLAGVTPTTNQVVRHVKLKLSILIVLLLVPTFSLAGEKADMVLVIKSDSRLYLKKMGKSLKNTMQLLAPIQKGINSKKVMNVRRKAGII